MDRLGALEEAKRNLGSDGVVAISLRDESFPWYTIYDDWTELNERHGVKLARMDARLIGDEVWSTSGG
ncbi:MAG TPA: hypothetical protein VEJ20_00565, partial [Candidatus Eremiobacteraceae bacterium]|nr:hypothetical protein [Candidatus Eremiobacteraceae bacterium]